MISKTDLINLIKTDTLQSNSLQSYSPIKLKTLHYCFMFAAENGHTKSVKIFLTDPRTDPAIFDNYAIKFASKNGHYAIVALL